MAAYKSEIYVQLDVQVEEMRLERVRKSFYGMNFPLVHNVADDDVGNGVAIGEKQNVCLHLE